jgi:hypothetical protein
VILKPCHNCLLEARKDCGLRAQVREKIRGAGLTSAWFKCKILDTVLEPGTRVSADFRFYEEAGYGVRDWDETIEGTVMKKVQGGKILIWLDEALDGAGERFIVKLFPKRLTLLPQDKVPVCPECGRPEGRKNREDWFCGECGTGSASILPENCGESLPW